MSNLQPVWPRYKKDTRNANLQYLKIHSGAVQGRKNHPETKSAFQSQHAYV